MLKPLTQQLLGGAGLTDAEVTLAVEQLTLESVLAEEKANFLSALAKKGETIEEIAVFARELRLKAIVPPLDEATRAGVILDVCGTGGDRLTTFNISTTVALIVASGGIPVAKHGNRAITSRCGSADVLEALGIPTALEPADAARSLRDHQFAFFFAPRYHPVFKHIGPARRICADRGQRTIFNFLGPLLNPARPNAQLLGVPQPDLCEPLARVLRTLGLRRAMVVSGRVGDRWLDELSILGENTVAEFGPDLACRCGSSAFASLRFQPAQLSDLRGGDAATNAEIIRRLLTRKDAGPRRDIVLLNAAAAFCVAGKCRSMSEGWDLADHLLATGEALAKLDAIAATQTNAAPGEA